MLLDVANSMLLLGLGLKPEEAPQFYDWNELRQKFTKIFASKTQSEWCQVFDDVDACVTPVLTTSEAVEYRHNKQRHSFQLVNDNGIPHEPIPVPAPRLADSPPAANNILPDVGEHSVTVLTEYAGYSLEECQRLLDCGVVEQAKMSRL